MRVREKWNLDVDRIKTQGKVSFSHDGQVFTIRVLKIRLPSGEMETLLTNLNQKQLPIRNAGELYFKRWGIETAYDTLKSKLQLENFSLIQKGSIRIRDNADQRLLPLWRVLQAAA